MSRGYQPDFSELYPDISYDRARRERKSVTVLAVLQDYFGERLSGCRVADLGCSIGVIDHALAAYVLEVIGSDIDQKAIEFAQSTFQRSNLQFMVDDAVNPGHPDQSFDVVLCSHVYEHVPDPSKMMREIFRILRPQGVCYFAAGNRYALVEPHYRLPFLSWIPRPLADVYLRLSGRGRSYYEEHFSHAGLRRLVAAFRVHDYTRKLIAEPNRYRTEYMIGPGTLKQRLAQLVVDHAYGLMPGYVWLLEKLGEQERS